ncbi:uncharacterized protein LOC131659450 [Vicia villosa]|uniref:uncharacterized protein LOC131659450 n=1 Tax=Vicia villosa TaxID=3911 RepID=UPI00273AA277|nr:uncharacterized protein LOC131659450 [Vicia villosa]
MKWEFVSHRRLALERELGKDDIGCKEVISLVKEAGLTKTISGIGDCYETIVKEFIVNIPGDCDNKRSRDYKKVFVRGKCVEFSPRIINRYLGRCEDDQSKEEVTNNVVYKEITAGQVTQWPRMKKLSVSNMSVKYVVLNKIGAANWVPTNHTSSITVGLGKFIYIVGTKINFDLGTYIFEQTIKHAHSFVVKMPIASPTLICAIIFSQHIGIMNNAYIVSKSESPLYLHYKLFIGTHVPDIVTTSGKEVANLASKEETIAELQETCKELNEIIKTCTGRKIRLENLIRSLDQDKGVTDRDEDNQEAKEENDEVKRPAEKKK